MTYRKENRTNNLQENPAAYSKKNLQNKKTPPSKTEQELRQQILQLEEELKEQKKSEKNLRLFRNLIDQMGDFMFILDVDSGKMLDVTQTTCEKLGYTREELLTLNVNDISMANFSWKDHVKELQRIDILFAEDDHKHKDGTTFPVEVCARYIPTEEKSFVVSVIRDIRDRKRTEQEKEKLETLLRQSQKLETLGTLAGGIAHDFNNILTPIIGYTEMMLSEMSDTDHFHEPLNVILKSALRAKSIIKQILTFSRKDEPERLPVMINMIVREDLKALRSMLPSNIEFRERIDTKPLMAAADPLQVHQAVMNLCTNAYQAMHDTGGVLEVSVEMEYIDKAFVGSHPNLKEGNYVRIGIKDTGQGMDKKTMERIFDPFFTTKDVGKGTGLGLSVVYGIVLNHGGEITVSSELNKGSTFNIYLPAIADVSPDPSETGKKQIIFN